MKTQVINQFHEICSINRRPTLKRIEQNKNQIHFENQLINTKLGDGVRSKCYKRTIVTVPLTQLESQLSIYQWRSKTNHPILFSTCIGVNFKNPQSFIIKKEQISSTIAHKCMSDDTNTSIEVQTQLSEPLEAFMPLSFSQHLYTLKESLYGFEQLNNHFGSFHVHPTAIRVNQQMKIKVWCSNILDSNPIPLQQKLQQSEKFLIKQIITIFFNYRLNTSIFRQFYDGASQSQTFLQLVKFIDGFIEKNKIKIDKRLAPLNKKFTNRAQSPKNNSRRVPKFLSPSGDQNQLNNASTRLSMGDLEIRRKPLNSLSPSKKQSGSLKKTVETQTKITDYKVNLVRTDKQRKGSGNNFCFTSLHKLQAARQNLKSKSKAKASQICFGSSDLQHKQFDVMASANAQDSLLKNFDKLFEQQSQIDYLSVSINLEEAQPKQKKAVKLKKLSNYGRTVKESIINNRKQLIAKD